MNYHQAKMHIRQREHYDLSQNDKAPASLLCFAAAVAIVFIAVLVSGVLVTP